MKKIIAIVIVLAVVGAVAWQQTRREQAAPTYRLVEIEYGDVVRTVSATGALSAVKTVDVGTQVSGQVASISVDFNDVVRKGQLIARIDPTLPEQAVREAEISVQRAKADLEHAEQVFERDSLLHERQILTESEFETTQYNRAVARTGLASAEASLERAQRSLGYTYIYAPVDGVVVERGVDEGQTVAASLSAPLLFQIAEDLSQMEILATVDESDIGMIEVGQPVHFTVQAYPEERFVGSVRQVRLQSQMTENVVSYIVVVDVSNPDGRLLPGMTATVDFVIESAEGVAKVSNAALRFRPTEEMLAQIQAQREQARDGGDARNAGDTLRAAGFRQRAVGAMSAMAGDGSGGFGGRQFMRDGADGGGTTMLWMLDEGGQPTMIPVRTGISDGQYTVVEPVGGAKLDPGTQVIAGMLQGGEEAGPTNPFQQNGPGGGRFGPGGF